MQRLIVRSGGVGVKASARAVVTHGLRSVHTTPPTGSSSAERAVHETGSMSMVLNTSSAPKKGKVPDFIINHVAPIHSGSQWLQTKRQSEEEKFGEASLEGGYKQFREDIKGVVPDSRVFTDPLRTLAYGTDASFYRLVPKIVVKVHDEAEMIKLIQLAAKNKTPITFRAGGTSLSGQAITDSILLKLGHTWRYRKIENDGKLITVEPGWILGQVNRMLAPYGRKLGPDPSSIESCWIGGVVSNNSSGMCCGVLQNTYHTIKDLRLVMHDGTILDTADPISWASFQRTHKNIVDGVVGLADRIRSDEALTALIKKKFSIKCTTGYSINALVGESYSSVCRKNHDKWCSVVHSVKSFLKSFEELCQMLCFVMYCQLWLKVCEHEIETEPHERFKQVVLALCSDFFFLYTLRLHGSS